MKQPPAIEPASVPGPGFDPMDRIVEDLENIESFLDHLQMNPQDLAYLNQHLPGILALRRTISHQLVMLEDEPYNYPPARLKILHEENEMIFIFLERVVGTMNPWDEKGFKQACKAVDDALIKFDNILTP